LRIVDPHQGKPLPALHFAAYSVAYSPPPKKLRRNGAVSDQMLRDLIACMANNGVSPDVTKTQAAHRFEIEKGPPLWLKGGATQPSISTTKAFDSETKETRFAGA
jgi:hypothetical protein